MRRRRIPCDTWPCRRCDAAGRSSWRSRERWHNERRSHLRVRVAITVAVTALIVALIVAWSAVILAVTR